MLPQITITPELSAILREIDTLADDHFRMMNDILDQEPGLHRIRLQASQHTGEREGS